MVRVEDYLALEDGVSTHLNEAWRRAFKPLMPKIARLIERGRYDQAEELIWAVDVQSIAEKLVPGIRNSIVASLTFGAMLARGDDRIRYRKNPLPPVLDPVTAMYVNSLERTRQKMAEGVRLLAMQQDLQKADTGPSQAETDDCPHHPTPTIVMLLKAAPVGLAAKLNAVVMGQAKGLIDIAANANTTRLVGLGFMDELKGEGVEVYQISGQLDGRMCPVCRTMHGKTFQVAQAYDHLLSLLQQTDPDAIKAMAPWPSQSKASVAQLRSMSPSELQARNIATPPFHGSCRCRQVKVGTVPSSEALPVLPVDEALQLPDVPLPAQDMLTALGSKELTATMRGAADALKPLSDKELLALDKIFHGEAVNKWLRVCSGPNLVQKAEAKFSFCSAFNPKKMGEIVADGQKGVKTWELDDEAKLWRIASGDFGKELLDNIDNLVGSVIHDKGFTLWGKDYIPDDGQYVRIHVTAPKGTKAVKVAGQYAFPNGTKFQVYDKKLGTNGVHTVYVKVLDEAAETANLDKPSAPWWWTRHIDPDDTMYHQLKAQGYDDKTIWDQNEEWIADGEPGYQIKPFPGDKPPPSKPVTAEPEIVPAGTTAKQTAQFALGDDYLDYPDLKHVGPKPGGSVPGETMADPSGQKWIVKYAANEEIARNEVLAGKLYEALGIEVPELRLVRGPKGEVWLASKWDPNFELDADLLKGFDRVPGLYDGFVADAWLSNWDVVGLGYDNIGVRMGRAFRIDVGGALRFRAQGGLKSNEMFPDKVVDLDNLRNPDINPNTAQVFKGITEQELRSGALKVINLPDDTIRKLIKTYGPVDPVENDRLVAKMLARKQDIAERFKTAEKPVRVNLSPEPKDLGARITAQEQAEIVAARVNGKSLRTDFDDIEGQNVLIHVEKDADGQDWTVATFKVRGETAKRVEANIASKVDDAAVSVVPREIADAVEEANQTILALVKGINKRINDGAELRPQDFERYRIANDKVAELLGKLDFGKRIGKPITDQITDHYLDYLRQLSAGMGHAKVGDPAAYAWPEGKKLWVPFDLTKVKIDAPAPKATSMAFRKVDNLSWDVKDMDRGFAKQVSGQVDLNDMGHRYVHDDGDFGVEFIPGSVEAAALRNQVTIRVKGVDAKASERVFKEMDKLGIKSHRASDMEKEHLYLMEMSYLKKETWQQVNNDSFRKKSMGAQIDHMREMIAREYGVPEDEIIAAAAGREQAFAQGLIYHERVDLRGKAWDEFVEGYRLIHDNTGSFTMPGLIDVVLNSGGRMITTVDKRRRGINMDGMSPRSDLGTGGADYFFTRISTMEKATQASARLVFKANPVKRTTTISYRDDMYGKTSTTDFIQSHRNVSLADMKRASGNYSNETIIKGGLSLFDDLDVIVVSKQSDVDRIMEIFRKHGLSQWPDGRKLEDIVVLKGTPLGGVPDWAKGYEAFYGDKLASGFNEDFIKQTISDLKANQAKKDALVVPGWASKKPDVYKNKKMQGMTEEVIQMDFKAMGLYHKVDAPVSGPAPVADGYPEWLKPGSGLAKKAYDNLTGKTSTAAPSWPKNLSAGEAKDWMAKNTPTWLHPDHASMPAVPPKVTVTTANLGNVAGEFTLPNGLPSWAHGYESYYQKWMGEGLPLAKVKEKVASHAAQDWVYPSWVKESWAKDNAKKLYKQLKQTGQSDFQIQQNMHASSYVDPPPVPKPTYPPWANGYESTYDQLKAIDVKDDAIKETIANVEKSPFAFPSWINPEYFTAYEELKKADGLFDTTIKQLHPEWVL